MLRAVLYAACLGTLVYRVYVSVSEERPLVALLQKSLVKKLGQVAPRHSSSTLDERERELDGQVRQWRGFNLYGSVWTH